MNIFYKTRKDVHPKYEYDLWRRPVIVHILQGESIRKKTELLKVLNKYKIKVDEYDKYVIETEPQRDRGPL